MTSDPLFTIIIPTRNRPDTLLHALETCILQEAVDLEIIVSDNFGKPATKTVVDAARYPNLRYIRTEMPLAMSAHWDFALTHARGKYVTILGDDDGLMPNALITARDAITRHNFPSAVHWTRGIYTWPSLSKRDEANVLHISIEKKEHVIESRTKLKSALNMEIGLDTLPMIYCAFIRKDHIDNLVKKLGRAFPTRYPDMFSALAFAQEIERYISFTYPLGIAGLSHNSNGMATLYPSAGKWLTRLFNWIARDFNDLNKKFGFSFHPNGPQTELLTTHVHDSMLFAKDLLFPNDTELDLNLKKLIETHLRYLNPKPVREHRFDLAHIRRTIEARQDLLEWFDALDLRPPTSAQRLLPEGRGLHGSWLTLDTLPAEVANIADAVKLADRTIRERHI